MATALDVITDALQMLGVYGSGDTISSSDQSLCLQVLNDLLDVWSNESLAAFAILEQNFALTATKQSYTIGAGGDINATRPLKILEDPGTAFVRDANNNDFGLEVWPRDKWNTIAEKSVSGNIPQVLFYDPQYPLGVINLWPVPNIGGYTAYFDSYQQLGSFATVNTTVSFPPGYKRSIGLNLAIELKPYFIDGQLDPIIVARAAETKGILKRTNRRDIFAQYEGEITARPAGSYNIYSDNYGPTS